MSPPKPIWWNLAEQKLRKSRRKAAEALMAYSAYAEVLRAAATKKAAKRRLSVGF